MVLRLGMPPSTPAFQRVRRSASEALIALPPPSPAPRVLVRGLVSAPSLALAPVRPATPRQAHPPQDSGSSARSTSKGVRVAIRTFFFSRGATRPVGGAIPTPRFTHSRTRRFIPDGGPSALRQRAERTAWLRSHRRCRLLHLPLAAR